MPDLLEIFRTQPDKYDLLVSREDYRGNLLPAIEAVAPLAGKDVVEFGAGTGRLTRLLAPVVKGIAAFDASPQMIAVAERTLEATKRGNWRVGVADNRSVPCEAGSADAAISAWSICCLASYSGEGWRSAVRQGLAEMRRVTRAGGTVIVVETLGTGNESPRIYEGLRGYFELLDGAGFDKKWIRTDYRFADRAEAEDLTRFFFGDGPVSALRAEGGGVVLPECTGIWWKAAT